MIQIDGSYGEGGGQILRTSLGLALLTGQAFKIKNIRAGRKRPGLMRQHLTAIKAAAEISNGQASDVRIGSMELTFTPGAVVPGNYRFAIGSAGSAGLVLQAVLPAFLQTNDPVELILEGGTHNPWAPPFHFLQKAYLPLLRKMGIEIDAELDCCGFYPAGGGRFRVSITPGNAMKPLHLTERGEKRDFTAKALVANLPFEIAEGEAKEIGRKMQEVTPRAETVESNGPGNIVMIELGHEHVTELITGFGTLGVSRKKVARKAVSEAKRYLGSHAAVGQYLADQLLIPMTVAGGGSFTTVKPTLHTETNIDVIQKFIDIKIKTSQINEKMWLIELGE